MKTIFLILITILSFQQLNCKDTWYSFFNEDSSKYGFKDINGIVKIPPKFADFMFISKFDDIMEVYEILTEDDYSSYYINKNLKQFGRDSLYYFDNFIDCESEGFIRYRDHKADRVGLFNKNGIAVIPAMYNEMGCIHNGITYALIGAFKTGDTEHYSYNGGKLLLIDTNNNVLIDSFTNDNLNYYSMEVSDKPNQNTTYRNFRGVNGKYYSFIDYRKEFEFFLSDFIKYLEKDSVIKFANDTIEYYIDRSTVRLEKSKFFELHYKQLKNELLNIKNETCKYNIFEEDNDYFQADSYPQYFDNCRNYKNWIYPQFSIEINHEDKETKSQNSFVFVRTESGYKLIKVQYVTFDK